MRHRPPSRISLLSNGVRFRCTLQPELCSDFSTLQLGPHSIKLEASLRKIKSKKNFAAHLGAGGDRIGGTCFASLFNFEHVSHASIKSIGCGLLESNCASRN